MVNRVQLQTGQVFLLMGFVFTLVTSSISAVWIFTESRNKALQDINHQIRLIDSRLSRIEGFLSVNREPLLATAEKQTIQNYINKKYYE